uniref:Uncharacterized protein n=1 Tax=viral metagenome TaxID=1070528 RepID=A0A6C0CMG1_9ZZZZ
MALAYLLDAEFAPKQLFKINDNEIEEILDIPSKIQYPQEVIQTGNREKHTNYIYANDTELYRLNIVTFSLNDVELAKCYISYGKYIGCNYFKIIYYPRNKIIQFFKELRV